MVEKYLVRGVKFKGLFEIVVGEIIASEIVKAPSKCFAAAFTIGEIVFGKSPLALPSSGRTSAAASPYGGN